MKLKERLAIITTHPIQYYAPLFRLMAGEWKENVKVFYTWSQAKEKIFDPDFGLERNWDIPLLEGYQYTFSENTSRRAGSHHFRGIVNPSLIKEIEDWQPDVILIFGWAFVSHLSALCHFKGKIPVVFRGDSTLLDEPKGFSFKKVMRRIFLRWVYSHIDYALYVGSANKQYYLAHGLKQKQLMFAPHAIDNKRFTYHGDEADIKAKKWRMEHDINSTACVFLFAGKLILKKDPEILIQSFLEIDETQSRLIITGNGELESNLKEKYKSFEKIVFIDFQNQTIMPVVYRYGNVFVLPSKGPGETWGLSVNEAMACERAVIVSDKCGCSVDLVVNGENGYVFKSGDKESLKNCMKLSFKNFVESGKRSYQIIKSWDYSATILQIEILFEKHRNETGRH